MKAFVEKISTSHAQFGQNKDFFFCYEKRYTLIFYKHMNFLAEALAKHILCLFFRLKPSCAMCLFFSKKSLYVLNWPCAYKKVECTVSLVYLKGPCWCIGDGMVF